MANRVSAQLRPLEEEGGADSAAAVAAAAAPPGCSQTLLSHFGGRFHALSREELRDVSSNRTPAPVSRNLIGWNRFLVLNPTDRSMGDAVATPTVRTEKSKFLVGVRFPADFWPVARKVSRKECLKVDG